LRDRESLNHDPRRVDKEVGNQAEPPHLDDQRILCARGQEKKVLGTPNVFRFSGGKMSIEFCIETATRIGGELEGFSVANQLEDIFRAIKDRAAMGAIFEVRSHDGAELVIQLVIKIVRYLAPNFFAVDFDGLSCQVILRSENIFSSCAAQFRRDELSGTPDPSSTRRRSPAPGRHA